MSTSADYKKTLNTLITLSKKYGVPSPEYYRSKLRFLGHIPVPIQRETHKTIHRHDKSTQWKLLKSWGKIFKKDKIFELKTQALFFLENFQGELDLDYWKELETWVSGVENWAHSDALCGSYAELFEKFPKELTPTYKKWNKSKNPWERRVSIIGLYYYARCRKTRFPAYELSLSLVKSLLNDDDFYVQKAVGWTLREMFQAYPAKTKKFIFSLAKRLHPLALYAATEKFSKADKKRFMKLRMA